MSEFTQRLRPDLLAELDQITAKGEEGLRLLVNLARDEIVNSGREAALVIAVTTLLESPLHGSVAGAFALVRLAEMELAAESGK